MKVKKVEVKLKELQISELSTLGKGPFAIFWTIRDEQPTA